MDPERTATARWYRAVRAGRNWDRRKRCYDELLSKLQAQQTAREPGERPRQAYTSPVSLDEIADSVHFSRSVIYALFDERLGDIVPKRAALVAEAKVYTFSGYRHGVLEVAGRQGLSRSESTISYLRALAAWTIDYPTLAACAPADLPAWTDEDLGWLSERVPGTRRGDAVVDRSLPLETAAKAIVTTVLDDLTMTPTGAFNTIRQTAEPALPLAVGPDVVAARCQATLAELAELIGSEAVPIASDQHEGILRMLQLVTEQLTDVKGETADEHSRP